MRIYSRRQKFKNEQIKLDIPTGMRYSKEVQKRTMCEVEYAEKSDCAV